MSTRPNILFMIADDHRFSAIRSRGETGVATPNLDELVKNGTCMENTYIMGGLTGAVCVPSRACLHTGVSVFRAVAGRTIEDSRGLSTLNPDLSTLAETFREEGYRTFAIGKWHNDKQSFQRGFKGGSRIFFGGMSNHLKVPLHEYDESGQYDSSKEYVGDGFSTELFSEAAVSFLRNYDSSDPFFLYTAFTSPHDPRMAPEEYACRYPVENISIPVNFAYEHPFDNGELSIRDEQLAPFPRSEDAVRRHIADYYAMITHMDEHIGRILRTLHETGHDQNTIVVYMSDHGLAVGQHGLMGKQNMYEHSVRVPLIFRGPGVPTGLRVSHLCHSYDVFPTLCDMAGIKTPETVESKSMLPLIREETDQHRDSVFTVYKDVQRMVTDGTWKLIRYYCSSERSAGENRIQLFNIVEDPLETHDYSDDITKKTVIDELAQRMKHWQYVTDDPMREVPILL